MRLTQGDTTFSQLPYSKTLRRCWQMPARLRRLFFKALELIHHKRPVKSS